ncbi:MAG: RdgB/HAM1 family non-canonical purine NTP pyrophosphatase [Anaerolineae bacterium]|nr:MAG: RdgB/HAM1 family non-canonical purine NTP pyrophosphatase [Anaerolineae bacterium]
MPQLLIATSNPGKAAELDAMLRGLRIKLVTPGILGIHLDVAETAHTYRENAALKARAYALASGLPTLADDSGLEVAPLNGLPGIRSARFAPFPNASDADRRAYLLENLAAHPRPWQARFVCITCLALPEGPLHFSEGICPGEITPHERGDNGFGYDPIFYLPERGCTMAELPEEEKNRISHRGRAIAALRPTLSQVLGE